jgi:hypothetical protein
MSQSLKDRIGRLERRRSLDHGWRCDRREFEPFLRHIEVVGRLHAGRIKGAFPARCGERTGANANFSHRRTILHREADGEGRSRQRGRGGTSSRRNPIIDGF